LNLQISSVYVVNLLLCDKIAAEIKECPMTSIKPMAELQRNPTAVLKTLKESQQPMYLTRNGASAIVVMDAEAFDLQQDRQNAQIAEELRAYRGILRGYEDVLAGRVFDAADVFADIEKKRGWTDA
jgi:PHD/YefM family antitoxin component YafN of YafNO toxin-antitoxin module